MIDDYQPINVEFQLAHENTSVSLRFGNKRLPIMIL
jgi:hypothetical protein